MRKRVTLLVTVAILALIMAFGCVAAFAANGFTITTTNTQGNETSGNWNAQPQSARPIARRAMR